MVQHQGLRRHLAVRQLVGLPCQSTATCAVQLPDRLWNKYATLHAIAMKTSIIYKLGAYYLLQVYLLIDLLTQISDI